MYYSLRGIGTRTLWTTGHSDHAVTWGDWRFASPRLRLGIVATLPSVSIGSQHIVCLVYIPSGESSRSVHPLAQFVLTAYDFIPSQFSKTSVTWPPCVGVNNEAKNLAALAINRRGEPVIIRQMAPCWLTLKRQWGKTWPSPCWLTVKGRWSDTWAPPLLADCKGIVARDLSSPSAGWL